MMIVQSIFELWETVYLKMDKEQSARMVTAILVRDEICYELSCGTSTSWHREKEITIEKNILAITD